MSSSSSDFKLKLEKKNIFASDEVEAKVNNPKKAKIKPRRIHFPRSVRDKNSHNSDREQSSLSPDKGSPKSKEKGNSSVP